MSNMSFTIRIYPGAHTAGSTNFDLDVRDKTTDQVADLLIAIALTLRKKEYQRDYKNGRFVKATK